jgi:ribonuclease III
MPLDPRREKQLNQLIQKLGLTAVDLIHWDLVNLALTHPTISPTENYERLEFVGDAVIRLTAAEFLYDLYPNANEGELSAIRGALVSDRLLAEIASSYGLDRYLWMAESAIADKSGQENRLASALEALLAALYLSTHTLELIRPWLDSHLQALAETIRQDPALQNYKGALQGLTQAYFQTLPDYRVTEIGRSATERFLAQVWFQDQSWGEGIGQSKKAAEQAAAKEAFLSLQARFGESS